jgi:hypothetical protein
MSNEHNEHCRANVKPGSVREGTAIRSLTEVAAVLGCNRGVVEYLELKALMKIREALLLSGWSAEDLLPVSVPRSSRRRADTRSQSAVTGDSQ